MSSLRHIKALVRDFILPRPHGDLLHSLTTCPLVVAGMFQTGNGIGRAARCCYEALKAEGLSPVAVDLSDLLDQVNVAPTVPLARFPHGKVGTLILFANPPEIERCLMALGLRRWHAWRIIGAWAWETSVAPKAWKRQTAHVSEIWAPSRFCAFAFEAAYEKPVRTVPHFVPIVPNADDIISFRNNAVGGCRSDALHILTLADARSSLERKNPVAAVKMFRAAFPDKPEMQFTLKCRNLKLYPDHLAALHQAIGDDHRIKVIDRTITDAELSALLDNSDIVLSPHRSEGFGLHLAEAMAMGKCVVATGWSGNLEFMNDDSAVLLPYRLVPVLDPTGVYAPAEGAMWAEPDIEEGARLLRVLAADPDKRKLLAASAREVTRTRLVSQAYLTSLNRS